MCCFVKKQENRIYKIKLFLNGDFIRISQELETKEATGDYKYEQAVTGSVVQFNQHGLQFLLL